MSIFILEQTFQGHDPPLGRFAGPGLFHKIPVIIGSFNNPGQVDIFPLPRNHRLKFIFSTGRGIPVHKWQGLDKTVRGLVVQAHSCADPVQTPEHIIRRGHLIFVTFHGCNHVGE